MLAVSETFGRSALPVALAPAPPKAAKLDLSPWLIEDGERMATLQENSSEYAACVHALVAAARTTWAETSRSARRDLTFSHLCEEPAKHRGDLVRAMGRLRRIRRFDPPALAAKEGIRDLYEGWIFDNAAYGAHPMCLLFLELPGGMEVGDTVDYPAAFDGYFFKRYRYDGADGKRRDAPLLIGRMPVLATHHSRETQDGLSEGTMLVIGFLSLLAGTLFLALGLAWWYRRGDRNVRARVEAARSRTLPNPFAGE